MHFPGRKEREAQGDPYAGVAYGAEITATPSTGIVDDGRYALPARLEACRRIWREAPAADFEPVGRRRWKDRATGTLYRRVDGAVMPEISPREACDLFIVSGGRIVPLVLDTRPEVWSVPTGHVVTRAVETPPAPAADDARIW